MCVMKNQLILLSSAAIFCSIITSSSGLRILGVFPFPMRSHDVMCEELMRGLAMKGHQVDVYSHFPLEEEIPNYRDFSLRGSIPVYVNNVTFDTTHQPSISAMMKHWLVQEGNAICNLLSHPHFQKLLQKPPKDPPYDLVITEVSIINCFLPFGLHLNVPLIAVTTVSSLDWMQEYFGSPVNPATDPSLSSPYTNSMDFFERLDNVYTYYVVNKIYNSHIQEQDKYIRKYFGSEYPNAAEILRDVSLLLINHNSALNGRRLFASNVVPVGGLHIVDHNKTLPTVVKKWLDESTQGCIYFSFGSMTRIETFPKNILDAFYRSFGNISPVRVLLKVAKPEELPPGLPSNVMTQSWFDQIQVLKHPNVKGFMTHGGLMSVQESIHYGVPMIAIPLGGDQHQNVAACVKRHISIKIDVQDISGESLTDALNKIVKDPSYKEAMQRVSYEFKDHLRTPLETAIYWTEYVARHGKYSLKLPAFYLPWWQASLIDVYCFVITILVSGLSISILLLIRVYRILRMRPTSHSSTRKKKNK